MSAIQVSSILAEAYIKIPPRYIRERPRVEYLDRENLRGAGESALRRLTNIPEEERHEMAYSFGIEAVTTLLNALPERGQAQKGLVLEALEKVAGAMALSLIYSEIEGGH